MKICFLSGAHIDTVCRLNAPAIAGSSNPGTVSSWPGGAGLNTASTAARLGIDASLVGPIGDDASGRLLVETLQARNINSGLQIISDKRTGNYTSIIASNGDLVIAVADLRINDLVTADWLVAAGGELLNNADGWFISSNLDADTLGQLIERAENRQIYAATISPAKTLRLLPVLTRLDLLFTNLKEARALLQIDDVSATDAALRLMDFGVKSGTISNGPQAVCWWNKGKVATTDVPPAPTVKDVTGAGDALAATMLAALAGNFSFADAVNCAIRASALTISVATPTFEEITWQMLEN